MQAVILAAGVSTRLRPLTNTLPKPMLPVLGKPMIEHIVGQLVSHDLHDIIITTHFCAERIREHFGDGTTFGARITYAHEDVLMNTAGSLKRLEHLVKGDFLVIGGNDLLPTIDLFDFIRFHETHGGIGTIAFKFLTDPELLRLFGQGVLDQQGKLVEFVEKPLCSMSSLVHTTYQICSPRMLEFIPQGIPCSIPEYLIRHVLSVGESIYGYRTESPFVCISTKSQYEQASLLLAEALGRQPPKGGR